MLPKAKKIMFLSNFVGMLQTTEEYIRSPFYA